MSEHYSQGINTKQAHKAIPEGHFEEEQGHLGFFGPASHLIRRQPSTRWVEIDGPLKPRMYDLVELSQNSGEKRLLFNNQVAIRWRWEDKIEPGQLIAERNADGDLLFFCHRGSGSFFTEYGELPYKKGHYIVMPKCVTYALSPAEKSNFFIVENYGSHYQEPDRGLVGRHAIYDPNALVKPQLSGQEEKIKQQGHEIKIVRVKHCDQYTTFKYAEEVFDVVGWKGDLYPYTLHVDDMMPLMSHRAHLPPSAHTTLVARDFVVCTFLPRPLESDKDALKVPFYHQNIDYDEVLFYHEGDFFSRDNLHAGMMSFHPAGFPHGPHPKAMASVESKTHTNEYAVMVDTRWPLKVDESIDNVELKNYWSSWKK